MSGKKILNIVLIAIGALMILPLFVAFVNAVMQGGGYSASDTINFFDDGMKDTLDYMDRSGAYKSAAFKFV